MVQWRNAAVKPPGQAKPDGADRRSRLPRGARSGQGLEGAEGRDHQQGLLDLHHGRGRAARDQRLRAARQPGDRPQERRSDSQGQRSCAPTAPRRPAPGSMRACSPTARTCRSAATRQRIRAASASIRASGGPGRTTCASSTTAHRATRTASRIRDRSRSSGGTSRQSAGRDTTCRTFPSRPTVPTRRTASGHSILAPRASAASSRPSTRIPTRRIRAIRATWPTCRRTARCRRCTSPSRARCKTSFTLA